MSSPTRVTRAHQRLASITAGAVAVAVFSAPAQSDQSAALPPAAPGDPPYENAITEAAGTALPNLAGHAVHDQMIHSYVLFDQLEWQDADAGGVLNWDARAWLGGDVNRMWLRSQGERENGSTASADLEALWGHAFARWWDIVAGVRQDFHPGPSQTWGALGVQGLAPYKFETELTAYLGESGQTALRLQVEYELLLTNRLVLQPLVELDLYGKDDSARGVGSGLSTSAVGLRLRYELRREFAPYIGVTWNRKWAETADIARMNGDVVDDTRWTAGLRFWF